MTDLRYDMGPPISALASVVPVTIVSEALGRRADVTVFDHGDGDIAAVVLLLHGVGSSHWAWLHHGGLVDAVARRRTDRRVVFVMPSDGLWGFGSGYVNWSVGRHEDWVAAEVPEVIDAEWNGASRVPWFVAGLSMGGYGALRLAVRHRRRFRAGCGLSPVTCLGDLAGFGTPSPPPDVLGVGEELTDLLIGSAAEPGRLSFTCGRDDPLIDPNRRLHDVLDASGVPHDYREVDGGHAWPVWRQQLPGLIDRFLGIATTT